MADNLLVPSIVHFNLGSSKVNITDYNMEITISNGCKYLLSIDGKGKRTYPLQKGQDVTQEAKINVAILKTPDKKFDDDIKKLEDALKDTVENDPKKYVKDMLFAFATNDDTTFANISFQGYVGELTHEVDEETALQEVHGEIDIYDPTTFNIKK